MREPKFRYLLCCLSLIPAFFCVENHALANPATEAAVAVAIAEVDTLAKSLGKANDPYIEQTLKLLDSMIEAAKQDQDAMLAFARSINANIANITSADDELIKFKGHVHEITSKLIEASYSDYLHKNKNLSNQIRTRLPNLAKDSLEISLKDSGEMKRKSFLAELEVISNRYINKKEFRFGLGASRSYIPRIKYTGVSLIDFTQMVVIPEPEPSDGGSPPRFPGVAYQNFAFRSEFSNQSYDGIFVTTRMPYINLRLSLPRYKESTSFRHPVRQLKFSDDVPVGLYVTTVDSTLEVDFDVAIETSLVSLIERMMRTKSNGQVELGFGVGLLGYQVTDKVTTEVRLLDVDATSVPYSKLPNGEVFASTKSRSFLGYYASIYYDFHVSDEFSLGFSVKKYFTERDNELEIEVEGVTFSFNATWYPTFSFLDD